MALVKHFKELRVYQQAFAAASRIYKLSKDWPKEERYSLTDQIRRSSRSVCANIAKVWRNGKFQCLVWPLPIARTLPHLRPPHSHTIL